MHNSGKITVAYDVADWEDGGDYQLEFDYPSYELLQPFGGGTAPYAQPTVYYNGGASSTAGTYSFRTRRIDNTPIQNIAKADWLWVSRVGASENNELISDISYADGMISFTATANRGNALIAAFDDKGEIVWS